MNWNKEKNKNDPYEFVECQYGNHGVTRKLIEVVIWEKNICCYCYPRLFSQPEFLLEEILKESGALKKTLP